MLKIKADRMGELEKFGFKEYDLKNNRYIHEEEFLSTLTIVDNVIEIKAGDDWGAGCVDNIHLDILYQLIKADMVEEVRKWKIYYLV